MQFRIADTFTDSLSKLNNQEQKAVKTTVFDLQVDPSNPGIQMHKLDKAVDSNFWSARVNRDIRIILHRWQSDLLLCYAGHHDKAYNWAERRKLEVHPKTGAMQMVVVQEKVVIDTDYQLPNLPIDIKEEKFLFQDMSDDELLNYGIPVELLSGVKHATEESILEIAEELPAEAAEALLDLATGVTPQLPQTISADVDPFDHPDAQRRFRVMNNVEELERALDFPWEKWTIFLHPAQRKMVEKEYNGPVRISGSAGTGKTIVALHRAVCLARNNPDTRVLLTTFSDTLANALRTKLRALIHHEPRLGERIEVYSIFSIAARLYELNIGQPVIASNEMIRDLLIQKSKETSDHKFSLHFLLTEWDQVVDAWQLDTWEAYRDVIRLGRKTRLPENRRAVLWSIFEKVLKELDIQKMITVSGLFNKLAMHFNKTKRSPFDFIIVDECQDVSVPQLRFISALSMDEPNSLFFAGDLGQRIFQQPFSWKALGIDIQGRSRTLRINYRTSHQIRSKADKLLAPEISDVDGNVENRRGTISVFNGPQPGIKSYDSIESEIAGVSEWLIERIAEGVEAHEIGVFVRSEKELQRAMDAVHLANLQFMILDDNVESTNGKVSISTMHLAKGLEFRSVVAMACDDEILPSQARIEKVTDDSDLEEVFNTERHLLYVACTRARDNLLVSGVDPVSEFVDDLRM